MCGGGQEASDAHWRERVPHKRGPHKRPPPRIATPDNPVAAPTPATMQRTAAIGSIPPRDSKLAAIGLSAYLEQARVGDDEQVLEKAYAWVQAQKPTSVDDIVQFNMVDDLVNALDLPPIPKTKLLGALKPIMASDVQMGLVMGTKWDS